jgi:hypothetical protein
LKERMASFIVDLRIVEIFQYKNKNFKVLLEVNLIHIIEIIGIEVLRSLQEGIVESMIRIIMVKIVR